MSKIVAKIKASFVVFCAVALVLCTLTMQGCSMSGTDSAFSQVTKTLGPNVAVITIAGTIQYDGSECSPEGLAYLLDKAQADPNIKAVVLRVNSGGGVATAGEEMTNLIKEYTKPVVVSCASLNASAAYQFSSQADYIFAAKSSAVGSIGTIIEITNMQGLYDKLGIQKEMIVSAENKDASHGFRELSETERKHYQDTVDQISDNFISMVAAGRNMDIESVEKLANGLTYTGLDCVENGLIDEIGSLYDACDKAALLAGLGQYNVVDLRIDTSMDFLNLLSLLGAKSSAQDMSGLILEGNNNGEKSISK